jgi:hypothetical protein
VVVVVASATKAEGVVRVLDLHLTYPHTLPSTHTTHNTHTHTHTQYVISNMLIVGVPLTYYGLRVNYDTGKGIARTDYPRRAIVASMWLENMSYYFELLLPYSHHTGMFGTMGALAVQKTKAVMLMSRDAIFLSNFIFRANAMFAFEIVGMLSSSYQGGEDKGDAPAAPAPAAAAA